MKNNDLVWLVAHAPRRDLLGIKEARVRELVNQISMMEPKDLPVTIGLFGNWGCGKTSFLGYLASELEREYPVTYFNAWKYAGFLEIVPALIYNIFNMLPDIKSESMMDTACKVMFYLGKKYGDQIGEWASKYLAVNPSDIIKDIIDVKQIIDKPKMMRKQIVNQYYTQIDKAQDLLQELLAGQKKPLVVLIDELDRCDPGEAFEVIKQLRIFFSMRTLPVIFVITANPEPIGLAIRHQYGLGGDGITDYEAKRILEKFVDTYVDMSDPMPLGNFTRDLWNKTIHPESDISFVHELDSRCSNTGFDEDTVKNCKVFDVINTNNRLYSNLRVLDKSLQYVRTYIREKTEILHWTAWHLEILKQVHNELFREVAYLAQEICWITVNAHMKMVRTLLNLNILPHDLGVSTKKEPLDFSRDEGNTPFAVYASWFWAMSRERKSFIENDTTSEGIERCRILKKWLGDPKLMNFVICMTLQPLKDPEEFIRRCSQMKIEDHMNDWDEIEYFWHFSWLLANY